MSTAHTPQPWEVNAKDFGVYTADDKLIATARTLPDMQLIGTAPEMLVLLTKISEAAHRHRLKAAGTKRGETMDVFAAPEEYLDEMRALIAKATGSKS